MINNPPISLLEAAQQHIEAHPKKLITKMLYEGQLVWVKQRPFSKKTYWHHLQHYLARGLRLAILSSTATLGGPESLKFEAARLALLASNQIAVPKVLGLSDKVIITEDVGQQLQAFLFTLKNETEKYYWLTQAMHLLSQLHEAGLCHGRPSLRDMTLHKQILFLIDLEENPLAAMSLAEAQARDIWLFFNSVARHCKKDSNVMWDLFQTYKNTASPETLNALNNFVKWLKPLRKISEYLPEKILGKDSVHAMMANKVLEENF